jgi:histidinol dehydrogenase
MKVWHLEKEWDAFLGAVIGGREQKKAHVREAVEEIKKQVLDQGDAALSALSQRFDGWQKEYPLRISEEEIRQAAGKAKKKDLPILRGMIRNVRAYHQWQRGQGSQARTHRRKGLSVTEAFVPVERTLVYVPGGQVPYPSSLVMGAVPAQIAGVKEIYITTPTRDGALNPYIAACCMLLGITNVYRLGGAQAIYAFSRGTGSIPKVDMIVGPGNAYVEEAKRDVYGQVGIDMLAGPSELAILVGGELSPEMAQVLAWDLFSQAEHDEMATVGLFCPSKDDLYKVMKEIERLLGENRRRETVEKALHGNGYLAHYTSLERAQEALNRIAPEHLEVVGDDEAARNIRYPGIIYVGAETCVSMGDYYIGTNHVLPTGGAGRFSAGLSVDRFTKRRVLVKIDRTFLDMYGDKAVRMAELEGLFAHGQAIRVRKELLR